MLKHMVSDNVMKFKKIGFVLIFTFLILLNSIFVISQEMDVFILNLEYNDDTIKKNSLVRSEGVLSTLLPKSGNYKVEIISYDNEILFTRYFDFQLAFISDIFSNESRSDFGIINTTNKELLLPYFKNSKNILIYGNKNNLLLEIDVSHFTQKQDLSSNESQSENFNLIYYFLIIFIILVFLIYKNKDRFRKEEISNMEEQLKEYIKNAKKQGQSKEEIKRDLINSNWPKNLIDKYL